MSADTITTDDPSIVIRDHVTVRDMVSFQSGGVADYFVICHKLSEIVSAVKSVQALNIPYRIIGTGSNVLFSDSGFPGLIIQNQTSGIVFIHERTQVMVDSGVSVEVLIHRCISLGYSGLEFLYGYPGTIGGAVLNNRRSEERSIGQYVRSATILNSGKTATQSVRRVSRDWFHFTPAGSRLKTESQKHPVGSIPIILSLTLQLSRMSHATCVQKVQEAAQNRKPAQDSKQPILQAFTNLDGLIKKRRPENPDHHIIVTRQQIRHWHQNTVAVLPDNPNYIKNHNHATSKEAAKLIRRVKQDASSDTVSVDCPLDFLGLWEANELP